MPEHLFLYNQEKTEEKIALKTRVCMCVYVCVKGRL